MKKLILSLGLCALAMLAQAQQSQTAPVNSTYFINQYSLTNGVLQGTTVTLGGSTNLTTNIVTSVLYTNNTGSGNPGFVTNTATTIYTNVVYPYIDCTLQSKVGVEFSFNCSAADTSAKTVKFAYSLDKVFTNNDNTAADLISWVVAGQGTTRVVAITNFANLGVGYLIPISIQDASATGGEYTTNFTFRYPTKKNAP
ncbi:MAG: hypothetical protein JWQ04_2784 [Pedosphaera sp.]|nr:hypothetical protein [Pedosphaera sp.]